MPMFKKQAAKREEKKDQKAGRKSDLAMAYAAQRASRMAGGGKVSAQDNDTSRKTMVSTKEAAMDHRAGMQMLDHEHDEVCYAHGGQVCRQGFPLDVETSAQDMNTPTQRMVSTTQDKTTNASARGSIQAEHDRERRFQPGEELEEPPVFANGGSVYDHIKRKRMAKGGMVDGGGYKFDIHDEIEHPNYYDDRNRQIADEQLYEDTYGPDPMDSNEMGRKLADADEHGRKMFSKIKMKKAQPGDRGRY